MAAVRSGQKYTLQVVYKEEYDTTGELELANYSQTFSALSEEASMEQLMAFVNKLMALTVYSRAPYRVYLIDRSELKVA